MLRELALEGGARSGSGKGVGVCEAAEFLTRQPALLLTAGQRRPLIFPSHFWIFIFRADFDFQYKEEIYRHLHSGETIYKKLCGGGETLREREWDPLIGAVDVYKL